MSSLIVGRSQTPAPIQETRSDCPISDFLCELAKNICLAVASFFKCLACCCQSFDDDLDENSGLRVVERETTTFLGIPIGSKTVYERTIPSEATRRPPDETDDEINEEFLIRRVLAQQPPANIPAATNAQPLIPPLPIQQPLANTPADRNAQPARSSQPEIKVPEDSLSQLAKLTDLQFRIMQHHGVVPGPNGSFVMPSR